MRVTGTVVFRTGGWSCSLRECNPGINPQMLCLELLFQPPAPGEPVTDALTPCSVEWAVDDPAIEYQQVQFRINTEDEPPATIDVEHVQ